MPSASRLQPESLSLGSIIPGWLEAIATEANQADHRHLRASGRLFRPCLSGSYGHARDQIVRIWVWGKCEMVIVEPGIGGLMGLVTELRCSRKGDLRTLQELSASRNAMGSHPKPVTGNC